MDGLSSQVACAAGSATDLLRPLQTRWNEVGRGHTRLPREAGAYGELPLEKEGVELEAGQTCLFFLCCPSSAGGIAFR